MRKILLGLLLVALVGILPVSAHDPVDVGTYNTIISVEGYSNIVAKVKVQDHEGHPYNIKTYKIARHQKTITLVENNLYDAAGKLQMTDNTRWVWTYSQKKISEQYLHDCIYEAAIKWADEEKKKK
ncbi:hypothetical protein [Sporomusa acidovorans]|uniref:Uncharacterized protein n=1 Tax=Sporomusa acidovorans (strain ATCC 49682 / DSM 3132 / Mol) TaxID=1123286 RepID=A0ABZ3JAF3_SPOA4|nr:hypothetical protein [Sporomusa acidovorans]OZC13322.1 hypothetical protein SPACI_58180 [Sporomusa acidovorans DSM 3132]SDD96714.1 hypothetical protein SAMN04488499_100630 [Sporomusa acidovorans]